MNVYRRSSKFQKGDKVKRKIGPSWREELNLQPAVYEYQTLSTAQILNPRVKSRVLTI